MHPHPAEPLLRRRHAPPRGRHRRAPRPPLRPRRPRCLPRRPRIDAGVSRVEEIEETLDPELAVACANDTVRLGRFDSPIIRLVAGEYGVGGDASPFVCLGGFRNTRSVYDLEGDSEGLGLVLELDETRFDFGTSYELECETAEPYRAKEVLERLLMVAGVLTSILEAISLRASWLGSFFLD
jgi:hypothetical protein